MTIRAVIVLSLTLFVLGLTLYVGLLLGIARMAEPACQENPPFFLKGSFYDCVSFR